MNSRLFTKSLAILLVVVLIMPSAFFVAPKPAHAFFSTVLDPSNLVANTISVVKESISSIAAVTQ